MLKPKSFFDRCRTGTTTGLSVSLGVLAASFLCVGLSPRPACSAERVYISYSLFERSISVDSLEIYAREGKLEGDLAAYARYTNPQQLEQLQRILNQRLDLDAVVVSKFLYTFQGESLLNLLGEVIQTENRLPGFHAIRAALILAAADPEGLTLLNVLQKYPTTALRIDLARSLQVMEELQTLVAETEQAIALVKQQHELETETSPTIDFAARPDVRQPGSLTWEKRTIRLTDAKRDRTFLSDLYLPHRSQVAPVIIISHGVGSDRTSFTYLGEHLASHGFAVAIPDHPGSSAQQVQNFLRGKTNTVIALNELIDRPLDITLLLDEIGRLAEAETALQGRLNLQSVGIIGQSFGGYTALVAAGAAIDFPRLHAECAQLSQSWNISLLLQCQATELPDPDRAMGLADPRIKAAIAINPIDSSILGPKSFSQMQVPVMLVSGTADTVAPPLAEQIRPFTWLNPPHKYLALMHNATHFSTIGQAEAGSEGVPVPAEAIGPDPLLAQNYLSALSVAFLKTHIESQSDYGDYLTARYVTAISKQPIPLNLVQQLTPSQLTQALQNR